MTLELDASLSQQLADCTEGENITLSGTLTKHDTGRATVTITSAESADADEGGSDTDQDGEQGGQSMAEEPGEAMPMVPGPVKTLLGKRK